MEKSKKKNTSTYYILLAVFCVNHSRSEIITEKKKLNKNKKKPVDRFLHPKHLPRSHFNLTFFTVFKNQISPGFRKL